MIYSGLFTLVSIRYTKNGFRYSDMQVEHDGAYSERLMEMVYYEEDIKAISRLPIKERRSESSGTHFDDGVFMNTQPSETNPNNGEDPIVYRRSTDIFITTTYDQFRNISNPGRKLNTSNLTPIVQFSHSDFDGEVVIGINKSLRKKLRASMLSAVELLNVFQDTYSFSFVEMDYRHRDYHHIWFRDSASMLAEEIIETRVPDGDQGLMLSFNEFDHEDWFGQEMQILMIVHEILVGLKYAQGTPYVSKIDEKCMVNTVLEEDSSYLPGQARNLTTCHAELLKEMLEQI